MQELHEMQLYTTKLKQSDKTSECKRKTAKLAVAMVLANSKTVDLGWNK